MNEPVAQRRLGIALALIANSVWGCAALYWVQTAGRTLDVLAHRASGPCPRCSSSCS